MFEYFKNNYAWNLAAVTLIEDVGTISEPAEAFAQVAHLATGDAEEANAAWHDAMVALADRLERMGKEDFGIGRPLSAARKHHRAAMYLLRAERMISHHDERRLVTYRRALENYRAARQLGADGVEFIDIPYKAGSIPAIFVPAEPGKVSPIIVHLQGFDSVKETQFPFLQEYRRRGLSCLIVDQPGAGGALRLHGLTVEVETEHYVGVILDYLEGRADTKTQAVGLAGISMGGYFAPRAAAFEKRIKALAVWGAFFDFNRLLARQADPVKANEAPSVPNPANHALWAFGADSPQDMLAKAKAMTLEGVAGKITCPILIFHGESDRQVPVQHAIDTYEAVASKDKTLKIFTADEGGVEHCQIDNRAWAGDLMADWFAERLGPIEL